jgi:hypothetical protein
MRPCTDIEKANNTFFGNLVNIDMQLEELKVYLNEVHNFIKITNVHLNSDRESELDYHTLENLKYHFKYTQGEILRKSIIISTVILLEAEIDTYCEDFKTHKNISVSYREFRGDLLDKFKLFSVKLLNSDFNFQGSLWNDVIGLYEVRNSLVHNNGLTSNFGKRKTIENFIKRNQSYAINENEKIIISHQACLDSITIVEKFFEEITLFALRTFPDRYKSDEDESDNLPF